MPTRTIRFYTQEKLLPPPGSFKGRTALYSEKHLEILKLIKTLKEKRFMPLSTIKEVIDNPEKLALLYEGLEINEEIFNLLGYQPPIIDSKQMLERGGTAAAELEQLESFGFVHPSIMDGSKQYSETDLAIVRLVKKLLGLGLQIKDMKILPDILSQLAKTAVNIIHNRFHNDLTIAPDECLQKLEDVIAVNKELTVLVFQQLIQEAAKEHILSDLQNGCRPVASLEKGE